VRFGAFLAFAPYLGGKQRLAPLIFARLGEVVSRARWRGMTFAHPLLAGESISLYARAQGLRALASDIAERSAVVGLALLDNSHTRLRLVDLCQMQAQPAANYRHIAEDELVSRVLDGEPAAFADRALHNVSELPEPKQSLLQVLLVKWLLGLHPTCCLTAGDAEAAAKRDYDQVSPSGLPTT